MNRTALCIRMLMYLKANGLTNTRTLADVLETNPRNIREFKKELVTAGYNIKEIKGRYGGYMLDENDLFPALKLTDSERDAVADANQFLKSHREFEQTEEFEKASIKILNTSKDTDVKNRIRMLGTPNVALSRHERQMLSILMEAKKRECCARLIYRNAFEDTIKEPHEVLLDPYEIILWSNVFNNAYYAMGYKHNTSDVRCYRISDIRMQSCELTDIGFLKDPTFHLEQHVGKTSLFKHAPVRVTVSVLSENVMHDMYWGQNVRQEEENVFSFDVDDLHTFYSQVFFKRDHIQILSPDEVAREYTRNLKTILRMYENEV